MSTQSKWNPILKSYFIIRLWHKASCAFVCVCKTHSSLVDLKTLSVAYVASIRIVRIGLGQFMWLSTFQIMYSLNIEIGSAKWNDIAYQSCRICKLTYVQIFGYRGPGAPRTLKNEVSEKLLSSLIKTSSRNLSNSWYESMLSDWL